MAEENDKALAEVREYFDASVKEVAAPFKRRGIKRVEMREFDQDDAYRGIRHPMRNDEFVIMQEGGKLFVSPSFVKECFEDSQKNGDNSLAFYLSLMAPTE